jgi:hypothetical protein
MTTVRGGQLKLATVCDGCGLKRSDPTLAAKHGQRCAKLGAKRGDNLHIDTTRRPRSAFQGVGMESGQPEDSLVCSPSCADRGLNWSLTFCLCDCHFRGPTARQLLSSGALSAPDQTDVPEAPDARSPRRGVRLPDVAA